MNKPPTFLFLDDSLVKERKADPEGPTLHRRRADSPVARPIQPTSAMKSAAQVGTACRLAVRGV